MRRGTETSYEVRITRVYGGSGPVAEDTVFYDYVAVDTQDVVAQTRVAPFRRIIFAGAAGPALIMPAVVGDHATVAICQGQARLTDVPEQYVVDTCNTPLV